MADIYIFNPGFFIEAKESECIVLKKKQLVLYRKRYLLFISGPKRRLIDVYILSKVLLTYIKVKVLIKSFFPVDIVCVCVLESLKPCLAAKTTSLCFSPSQFVLM